MIFKEPYPDESALTGGLDATRESRDRQGREDQQVVNAGVIADRLDALINILSQRYRQETVTAEYLRLLVAAETRRIQNKNRGSRKVSRCEKLGRWVGGLKREFVRGYRASATR